MADMGCNLVVVSIYPATINKMSLEKQKVNSITKYTYSLSLISILSEGVQYLYQQSRVHQKHLP